MSTLKVNKLRDTAGSADAITLDPNGGAVLAGVTTVTSVKVGAAVTISESGIEASGIGITCANINGAQIGGRRNIIINGAMNVAQRGTSSTSDGYQTVDRFRPDSGGEDETPEQRQANLGTGDTGPYEEGFRKAFKITNGNQTSGAGAADYIQIEHRIEAQDLATSGWNYTSSSSFITLSFWVKSSVSQKFQITVKAYDGTSQSFQFETPTLSANTWTKVVKTIPGNSNLTINNDNGVGLSIFWFPYIGTDYTDAGNTLDGWQASSGSTYGVVDDTSWYTTNDATFEITGVQLEVGSQATPFEHISYAENKRLCMRYFEKIDNGYNTGDNNYYYFGPGYFEADNNLRGMITYKEQKRATPTITFSDAGTFNAINTSSMPDGSSIGAQYINTVNTGYTLVTGSVSGRDGQSGLLVADNTKDAYVLVDAEL